MHHRESRCVFIESIWYMYILLQFPHILDIPCFAWNQRHPVMSLFHPFMGPGNPRFPDGNDLFWKVLPRCMFSSTSVVFVGESRVTGSFWSLDLGRIISYTVHRPRSFNSLAWPLKKWWERKTWKPVGSRYIFRGELLNFHRVPSKTPWRHYIAFSK